MARKTGIKAWLITWEGAGDHVEVGERIAAILNSRWSSDRVASYMQFVHDQAEFTLREYIGYLNRPSARPYKSDPGGFASPYLHCGHNPHLVARPVSGLRLEEDPNEETETIFWTEPTHRRIDPNTLEVLEERPGPKRSLKRPLGAPIGGR